MKYFAGIVLLLLLSAPCLAQELEFPETEEDFVRALSPQPAQPAQSRGLGRTRSFGTTRGLNPRGVGGIKKDQSLEQHSGGVPHRPAPVAVRPKAGALVLFATNSAQIDPASYALLDNLGRALKNDLREATITIAGHTDDRGSETYNQALSLERAMAVRNYLMTYHGIDPFRLRVVGYGESQPLMPNETAHGRSYNRRVEFIRDM